MYTYQIGYVALVIKNPVNGTYTLATSVFRAAKKDPILVDVPVSDYVVKVATPSPLPPLSPFFLLLIENEHLDPTSILLPLPLIRKVMILREQLQ